MKAEFYHLSKKIHLPHLLILFPCLLIFGLCVALLELSSSASFCVTALQAPKHPHGHIHPPVIAFCFCGKLNTCHQTVHLGEWMMLSDRFETSNVFFSQCVESFSIGLNHCVAKNQYSTVRSNMNTLRYFFNFNVLHELRTSTFLYACSTFSYKMLKLDHQKY